MLRYLSCCEDLDLLDEWWLLLLWWWLSDFDDFDSEDELPFPPLFEALLEALDPELECLWLLLLVGTVALLPMLVELELECCPSACPPVVLILSADDGVLSACNLPPPRMIKVNKLNLQGFARGVDKSRYKKVRFL
jgi:hypothetical protein